MKDFAIRFIISAKSGSYEDKTLFEKIVKDVFNSYSLPDIQYSRHENHVSDLAKEWATLHGANGIVYIMGGDGAASEVAGALYGTETAMGLIPLGTGNDFARHLYGTKLLSKTQIIDLVKKTPQPHMGKIDLMRFNGIYSLNVISMGYDTVVLDQAYKFLDKWKGLGSLAYPLAVLRTLFRKKSYRIAYDLENKEGLVMKGETDASLLVLANGAYYGSGFHPTPWAFTDDGLGEFLVAEHLSLTEFLPLINKYKKGTHMPHPKLHAFSFSKGQIRSLEDRPILANYDGRIFEMATMDIEMIPRALNFAFLKRD